MSDCSGKKYRRRIHIRRGTLLDRWRPDDAGAGTGSGYGAVPVKQRRDRHAIAVCVALLLTWITARLLAD